MTKTGSAGGCKAGFFFRNAEKKISPYIPQNGHHQGDGHDHQGIAKQDADGCLSNGQRIDGPFDDKRDHKLQEVNRKKAGQTYDQGPKIVAEILFSPLALPKSSVCPVFCEWLPVPEAKFVMPK